MISNLCHKVHFWRNSSPPSEPLYTLLPINLLSPLLVSSLPFSPNLTIVPFPKKKKTD